MSSHAYTNILLALKMTQVLPIFATFIRPGIAITGSTLLADMPMLSRCGLCRPYLESAMIVTTNSSHSSKQH